MVELPTHQEGPEPDSGPESVDDIPASRTGEFVRSADELSESERWEMLHAILVGPETERIERLEQVPLAPKAKDVGHVLAEATKRAAQAGPELAEALAPTIEKGLMSSARKSPDRLAEAIYPVLGPAIWRSIQATLASAVQTLNVTLENSFSARGLQWRWQAWRTGRPFADVVLRNSLAYRVEQVYWIHKETSDLLCEVSGAEDSLRDPELVSGMLAAIQDYVQDSLEGEENGALEPLEVSGFRVLMAQGPQAVLAVLVRGTPPETLSRDLNQTLEGLHRSFGGELQDFEGDVEVFERSSPDLRGLLCQGAKGTHSSKKGQWLIAAVASVVLLVLLVGWIQDRGLRADRLAALAALNRAPGYSVQRAGSADGTEQWVGFKDPLAEPWAVVCELSTDDLQVSIDWTPFVSLESEMVRKRAEYVLQAPFGVQLDVDQGSLTIRGEASTDWVRKALAQAPSLPGVSRVDTSKLVDVDRRAIEQHARSLNGLTLPFGRGSSHFDRGQPVVQARMDALKALDGRIQAYGGALMRLQLQASLGRVETYEGGLSQRRLMEVQQALGRLGLSATVVEVMPAPGEEGGRSPLSGVRVGVFTLLPKP
ncbi:MAG: hypothetical protein ACI9X4_001786 [Glaciecola sp.]|jgi:hypothetical protein